MKDTALKITNNLFLGSMNSIPNNVDIVICCAEELFNEHNDPTNSQHHKISDDVFRVGDRYFFRWPDYPRMNDINNDQINYALKLLKSNIDTKSIYVHCVWGINRSASLVFMYLIKANIITADNYDNALQEFWKIYPKYSPNPGWKNYVKNNFDRIKNSKLEK